MGQSARVHIDYLDGIRGVAALFVTLHHIWQFVVADFVLGPLPRWFKALTIFKFGSFGVTVFIVLSGYCLMLPVARTNPPILSGGVREFVKRRARRILPPYYATVLASIAFVLAFPVLQQKTQTQWDIALPALSPTNLGLHLFLVHNLFQNWQWGLNPPLWSVALEWQIYFIFALVFVPLWRKFGIYAVVPVATLLGFAPVLWGGEFAAPWFILSFALGTVAAFANFAPPERQPSWLARLPFGKLALALFALFAVAVVAQKFHTSIAEVLLSLATAAFLIATTDRLKQGEKTLGSRLFAHAWAAKLGSFSYSLYLIHFPLVALLYIWLRKIPVEHATLFFVFAAIALPVVLTLSYAFYLAFERPFLRKQPTRTEPELVLQPAPRQ